MDIQRVTLRLGIMSFIMFMVAYFSTKLPQLAFFWGSGSSSHRVVYTRAEHPQFISPTTEWRAYSHHQLTARLRQGYGVAGPGLGSMARDEQWRGILHIAETGAMRQKK